MKTFVLIEDGVVVSRHIAANLEQLRSELPAGSYIREGNAWVGYTAEPDGSFTPPPPPAPTRQCVTDERERRIYEPIVFDGRSYQMDPMSTVKLERHASRARAAINEGTGEPGNYRWNGLTDDFVWIDKENNEVPMDAPTLAALWKVFLDREYRLTKCCKALKDKSQIPEDFKDDRHWI